MPITDNLVSFWELGEASGTRADSHGSNNLTDSGSTGSVAGVVGNAASFSGTTSLYILNDSLAINGDFSFHIHTLVNLSSIAADGDVLGHFGAVPGGDYIIRYVLSSNRFTFFSFGSDSTWYSVAANNLGAPSTGSWYHIDAWYDAVTNTLNIAVNDGAVDTTSSVPYPATVTGEYFAIGQGGGDATRRLSGAVDQTGFWRTRFLTSAERTWIYNGGNSRSYAEILAGMTGTSIEVQTAVTNIP